MENSANQRVRRTFDIRIQPASDSTKKTVLPKRKYSRVNTPEWRKDQAKIKVNPLVSEVTQFLDKKAVHCTLAVQTDQPAGKQSQRYFGLCNDPSPDDDDSDKDDRYDDSDDEDDEYRPKPENTGMRMKSSKEGSPAVVEPKYEQTGGVLWYLLDKLGSTTKFTNSEIRHEAQRAWRRYKGCRLNSSQKLCVLLAVNIRCRQATFMEILNGKGQGKISDRKLALK
ncbi:uncharacterized protein H6S33_007902 [Morchella sextelata]|uniref:uncharacterized protein n=1 Tax=Morchella sextelata TaxID=1174677 RepID=UPI001D0521E1|nr:uncharacterized protein H6S33_007902 [Morchella sextelata]KAH0603580.1 hypothetical protein H6S33_007902 [Morchella sextelata]